MDKHNEDQKEEDISGVKGLPEIPKNDDLDKKNLNQPKMIMMRKIYISLFSAFFMVYGLKFFSSRPNFSVAPTVIYSTTIQLARRSINRLPPPIVATGKKLSKSTALGVGNLGLVGLGSERTQIPENCVTTRIEKPFPQQPVKYIKELIQSNVESYKKVALCHTFRNSDEISTIQELRSHLPHIEKRLKLCFLKFEEIQVFCYEKKDFFISSPELIIRENNLDVIQRRLQGISKTLNSSTNQGNSIAWLEKKNQEVKILFSDLDYEFVKLIRLHYDLSLVSFKQKSFSHLRLVPLDSSDSNEIRPAWERVIDPNPFDDLWFPNDGEVKIFIVLFEDFLDRQFSEFYLGKFCPGSFYRSTPFFWKNSQNCDLKQKTLPDRMFLLSRDLKESNFMRICPTKPERLKFHSLALTMFDPEKRVSHPLEIESGQTVSDRAVSEFAGRLASELNAYYFKYVQARIHPQLAEAIKARSPRGPFNFLALSQEPLEQGSLARVEDESMHTESKTLPLYLTPRKKAAEILTSISSKEASKKQKKESRALVFGLDSHLLTQGPATQQNRPLALPDPAAAARDPEGPPNQQ